MMKKLKIKNLQELRKIEEIEEKEFIINLEEVSNRDAKVIIYYLSGLVFRRGILKKLKVHEFMVKYN